MTRGVFVERRRFPRQGVGGTSIKATLLLPANSLLKEDFSSVVEIDAKPINISQGGICVSLGMDAVWLMTSSDHHSKKELEIVLEHGGKSESLKSCVVRADADHNILGLEFQTPLQYLSPLLVPQEMDHV